MPQDDPTPATGPLTAEQALGVAVSVFAGDRVMDECQRAAPGMQEHLRRMGFEVRPVAPDPAPALREVIARLWPHADPFIMTSTHGRRCAFCGVFGDDEYEDPEHLPDCYSTEHARYLATPTPAAPPAPEATCATCGHRETSHRTVGPEAWCWECGRCTGFLTAGPATEGE